jgi:hypothetical protein
MTRQATHASTTRFSPVLPPPMHLPENAPVPELSGQIDELLQLEGCTISMLRATRRRGELGGGTDAMLAALEAEAMHRQRSLADFALQYGVAPTPPKAPFPPALASASTSLATAAFVVIALTVAGYRRLEDLASRAGDLEALRFAVTAIAEVGGAARQISRQIGRAGAAA